MCLSYRQRARLYQETCSHELLLCAGDLLGFLDSLGLRLPRVGESVSTRNDPTGDLGQAQDVFGHLNPLAALQQQHFLQVTKETGSTGSEELLITLGDAVSGPAKEPARVAEIIQEVVGS